jgi:hypothetical protein
MGSQDFFPDRATDIESARQRRCLPDQMGRSEGVYGLPLSRHNNLRGNAQHIVCAIKRRVKLVLLRIQGLGFKDPTLWPFFAGERKSGSSRQGFESLLQGKKHPKLPKISQIRATFGTKNFFAVFSAFLRVYPFGVNRDYCYGSLLWNLGIWIRKIRIGFKSFF